MIIPYQIYYKTKNTNVLVKAYSESDQSSARLTGYLSSLLSGFISSLSYYPTHNVINWYYQNEANNLEFHCRGTAIFSQEIQNETITNPIIWVLYNPLEDTIYCRKDFSDHLGMDVERYINSKLQQILKSRSSRNYWFNIKVKIVEEIPIESMVYVYPTINKDKVFQTIVSSLSNNRWLHQDDQQVYYLNEPIVNSDLIDSKLKIRTTLPPQLNTLNGILPAVVVPNEEPEEEYREDSDQNEFDELIADELDAIFPSIPQTEITSTPVDSPEPAELTEEELEIQEYLSLSRLV